MGHEVAGERRNAGWGSGPGVVELLWRSASLAVGPAGMTRRAATRAELAPDSGRARDEPRKQGTRRRGIEVDVGRSAETCPIGLPRARVGGIPTGRIINAAPDRLWRAETMKRAPSFGHDQDLNGGDYKRDPRRPE